MVNKIYNINLDLRRVTAQAESIPPLVDGDNGNIFTITLTDDGAPVDLSGCRVLCVFSKTDGSTVEQDTEDANVALDDYGITAVGSPDEEDTITITSTGISATASVSGTGVSSATVDSDKFLEKFPEAGEYEFVYFGTSWVYGMHSVVIGGTNHNVLTVFLKTASFGVGKNNCELQIYSGTVLVTTAQFNFDGRKGIINSETIQSEEKYPVLLGLIAEATNVLNLALPFQNPSVLADTLPAGSDATVTLTVGQKYVEWEFGIPQGRDGAHAPSDTPALSLGVAASGVSDKYSREDHVHPMPSATDVGAATPTDVSTSVGAITEIKIPSFNSANFTWDSNTHSSDTDGAFPYRCAIPATGATSSMIAEVVFGTESAMSGIYAPICECGSGVVYIWASEQTNPTVLSILLHK